MRRWLKQEAEVVLSVTSLDISEATTHRKSGIYKTDLVYFFTACHQNFTEKKVTKSLY
jgi:hypothetical protein